MKQRFWKILALALIAAVITVPVQAKKVDPIRDWRRTLFTSYGQHMLVFEAPVGMCFLDESDYLEGSILSNLKNLGDQQSRLIGTFGDCLEISKFQHDYQEAIVASSGSSKNPQVMVLKNRGSIYWINPDNGDDVISLPRSGYLDVREKTFRDDAIRGVNRGILRLSTPDKFKFDEQVRRTQDGLSVVYMLDAEVEYEKVHTSGIVATTLIRHMPFEFAFDFSAKGNNKDSKDLYAMMDAFLAQQIKLNAQMANQ
ncbi:MAG: hypothetical protein ACAH83_13210 [Alphaproteobacteria bacterium]